MGCSVQEDVPSRTAEAVAWMRATDQRRPSGERVLDDPYATLFLGPLFKTAAAALQATGRLGEATEARFSPGLTAFVLCRHRFMDDAFDAALSIGVDQVVVLGAGYDTRAYRFADRLVNVPVFEVDHPSTGARKAKIVAEQASRLPSADVRVVSIDFQSQALDHRLLASGFEPSKRTFVFWEGVSMYLTREAVKNTLATLRELCAPGSWLTMDWWYMVDAPDARSTVLRMSPHLLHLLGEPITFGIHPEDLGDFARRNGYVLVDIATASELERRYSLGHRRVYPSTYVTTLRTDERSTSP